MAKLDGTSMYEVCLLHSKADRALRSIISNVLDSYDITMMEWLLLGTVCGGSEENTRKGMSMTELSCILDVTLPQITALTAGLTSAKLVKQKISSSDRRSRRLVCTQQGLHLNKEVEIKVNEELYTWLVDASRQDWDSYIAVVSLLGSKPAKANEDTPKTKSE